MAKPKIPNQKSKYKALNKRLNKYQMLVNAAVATYITELVQPLYFIDYTGEEPLNYDNYPEAKGVVEERTNNWLLRLLSIYAIATASEWDESNKVQDKIADKVLSFYGVERDERFYNTNKDALNRFQGRTYSGNTTLGRLRDIGNTIRRFVEVAISVSIGSIPVIQKMVEKYFADPGSLTRDYKARYGKEPRVSDGRFQAERLISSEANIAYRLAEQERWRQMSFVVGYEVKRSSTHEERVPRGDVCDLLTGRYPKTFLWTGWHPRCTCYCVPILKTEDEYINNLPSANEVTTVPDAMKKYVSEHADTLNKSYKNGTAPYWYKDNLSFM